VYAVIRAGGKQHKVAPGDVIEIERVKDSNAGVEFVPLLVVDDDGRTRSRRAELQSAKVLGKVVGEAKGPKVDVFKYRSKSRYRRHVGHRQRYTSVEISDIKLGSAGKRSRSKVRGAKDGS
jgi:large subunit ribosomal protein L21